MRTKCIHKALYWLPLANILLLTAAACSQEEPTVPGGDRCSTAVTFGASLGREVTDTKGQPPLNDANLFTMGVFAGYEEEDGTFGESSPANDFINNVRYTRSFISNPFAGGDVCYWPFSGKLSFFAYAPYVSDTYLQFAPDYVSGYPRFVYAPTTDVTDQPDLCLAEPKLDQHMTTEPIPLVFHHSLSQVSFSANYSGDLPAVSSKLYVKVDSIRVNNLIGRKSVAVTSGTPCYLWQDDAGCPETDRTCYFIDRGRNHQIADVALPEATDPETDNYVNISTANGVMYLLPQGMEYGDVWLDVSYGYYEMVGTAETLRASVTTRCKLPAVQWEPAKAYRYKFTIELATSIIVTPRLTVDEWQDVDNTGANPIHIE